MAIYENHKITIRNIKNRTYEELYGTLIVCFDKESVFQLSDVDNASTSDAQQCNKQPVSVLLPDPALKLAGKLALAAQAVIDSKITTVSVTIAMLEDALNNYNNEIFSRQ